jgi:hypothetical protein
MAMVEGLWWKGYIGGTVIGRVWCRDYEGNAMMERI